MPTSPALLLLLFCSLPAAIRPADAFSAPSASDGGIKIVGLPGGQVQSLPGMYVKSFRRWIVDDAGTDANAGINANDVGSDTSETNCASPRMEPMKGAGLSSGLPDDGWVNPTTTSELWWPRDLERLQVRPTLNVLFRNGVLSYVSCGLDVRVPHSLNDDGVWDANDNGVGSGDGNGEVSSWRNYGLNSQPIARQWTTLDVAMERMFHVEGFLLHHDDDGSDDVKQQHDTLFPSLDAADAMQRVANFIAELDPLSPIAEGFHIASFPMMEGWTDLPSHTTKPEANDDGDETQSMYRIVCMATSEPFASKLLDMDEDLLAMSSTSVLEVGVSRTARGGDSPYLTEPYRGLYLSR